MADISIINKDNTNYNVKDAVGREALAVVENKGAKNIAEVTAVSSTAGGVDYTVNPDGTVIANRTSSSTSSTWFRLNESLSLKAGTYVLSGGKNSGERVLLSPTTSLSDAIADSQGSGAEFTLTEDTDNLIYAIRVAYNDSPSNVKFYPMICSKAEWDISQAYVPYGKTNAKLTNDTSTLFTENTRQETEIGVVANAGAKNLLYYNNLPNKNNGVTFTPSETTGIISISGTVTSGSTAATITPTDNLILPAGTYTFTCEDAKTANTADAYVQKYQDGSPDPTTIARSYENNTFTLTEQSRLRVRCRVYAGKESGQTFSPMIRPAAITDPTFRPYAKTNPELTVLTDEDRAALVELVDGGAKNLLKFESLSRDHQNGVDYTLNSDGSVTVNGTPSGTSESYVALTIATATAYDASEFCDGNHIISGCPSGGGSSSYRIQVAKSNYAVYDYGSGAILSPTTLTGVSILIYIPNGITVNNLVFRPMICTKAAWDISHEYQPYRPSWQEIYERIVALETRNT